MHPIERELKTMRGFAACLHDENCLDEADKELARLLSVEAAARRALEAWDTTVLPKSHDGMMQERMECLRADLGAELFNKLYTPSEAVYHLKRRATATA